MKSIHAPTFLSLFLLVLLAACNRNDRALQHPQAPEPLELLPASDPQAPQDSAPPLPTALLTIPDLQGHGTRAQFCLAAAGQQVWLLSDRVGHEPTPENPAQIDLRSLNTKVNEAWLALEALTDANFALDLKGYSYRRSSREVHDRLITKCRRLTPQAHQKLREIYGVGMQARRFQTIASNPESYPRETLDFRPWLTVDRRKAELENLARHWTAATAQQPEGREFQNLLVDACPISLARPESCAASGAAVQDAASALRLLNQVWSGGRFRYLGKFGVQVMHRGVRVERSENRINLVLPTLGIEAADLQWMRQIARTQWSGALDH